ncbi:hypothetical protein AMAG_13893 [Allomyces macrogynus ATCC 38327]|uniref:Uncharacterized protein n=1 Tax=Allomyces macrogynus (strain ATCC 38327) TaxID=578462 RepID=A0A0L0T2G4_ALLM3|nr:hypothetical protein AMAG_13893 [Allomyces macrogynus ATCC 38327]|eukprot:KNE69018.1 hypothetical protein AMAG_13893 [Allomyces macrogynus ATCC 38327]
MPLVSSLTAQVPTPARIMTDASSSNTTAAATRAGRPRTAAVTVETTTTKIYTRKSAPSTSKKATTASVAAATKLTRRSSSSSAGASAPAPAPAAARPPSTEPTGLRSRFANVRPRVSSWRDPVVVVPGVVARAAESSSECSTCPPTPPSPSNAPSAVATTTTTAAAESVDQPPPPPPAPELWNHRLGGYFIRISLTLRRPQFVWYCGHVLTVVGFLLHLVLKGDKPMFIVGLSGALVSYVVVMYRQHQPQCHKRGFRATVRALAADMNAHYVWLALFFMVSGAPCTPVLLPYFMYSLFHALTYFRSVLVPTLWPGGPAALPGFIQRVLDRQANITSAIQPRALAFAAYWEVLVTPVYVVIQVLLMQQLVLAPLVYANFMTKRYQTAAGTRTAFHTLRAWGDDWIMPLTTDEWTAGVGGKAIGSVGVAYIAVRNGVIRYAEYRAGTKPVDAAARAGSGTPRARAGASA